MGTGRKFNKKPATRPRKSGTERRRRNIVHRKRLVALGMDEEIVAKLDTKQLRDFLKTPVKTAAALAEKS